ncbi:endothelin-converting enzyme 2 [Rhipicephalus sanguineus]|nr:endothelin-converting enzyme 2 [Rhipicephalus sanguineus]
MEKLHAVVDMARLMTADALWMDNYTKALLRIKIHNASRDLWPPLIMLSQTGLSAAYAEFPSKWTSFVDTWIKVIKLSADLKHRNFGYNNLPSLLVGYQLPLFDYDYISNNVLTSVAALTSPFYYANGTKSMFYAGLGFFFAKELIRAIDDTGVTIDLTGREADVGHKTGDLSGNVSDLWLTATAIASSHNRSACLMPKHASVFPEVPALQISYAAYKTALGDREGNLRVAHQYTEDQMFFLTVCYLMCSLPGKVEPPMGDCNKAVSSFPAFGAAFGCADDAPMSASSRRCLYF